MASEKKPSIYSDRDTIGSSDELDEYGVWVKSEPQDLSSAGAENREFADSSLSNMEELPDFDTGFDEELSEAGDISVSDTDESFDFDDLGVPDLDVPEDSLATEGKFEDFTESADGDLSQAEEDFDVSSLPEDSSLDLDEEDFTETPPKEDFTEESFTEIPIEDFFEESPEEFEKPSPGEEMKSKEPPANAAGQADLSTQLLMKIAEELSSIRTELSTLKKEFAAAKGGAEEKSEAQQHGGFFDEEEDEKIALTGDELDNILNTADFTEEAGADATEELQGEYSAPEADDNASSDLFQDLTGDTVSSDPLQFIDEEGLQDLESPLSGGDDITELETSDADSEKSADLETIDDNVNLDDVNLDDVNLDNTNLDIDISLDEADLEMPGEESAGDSVSEENDISLDVGDFDVNLDDIDEAGFDLNDGEEVMQEEDADAEIIIDETKDSEELKRLRAEGAQPMTPAPEDTSYLDEDPLTVGNENILDESSIDLSQAVIDEPDLSAGITENPLQEPSPDDISLGNEDISIDLDMEEDEKTLDLSPESGLPEEEEEIEFSIPEDEITLPASSEGEDNFAQVIPEGFVVEADESQVPFEDDDDMEGEVSFAEEEDVASLDAAPDTAGVTEAADVNAEVLSNDESLNIPSGIRGELKTVLSYMDQLLESLPEEKIEEFAKSEYFDTYKKLFKELGLV